MAQFEDNSKARQPHNYAMEDSPDQLAYTAGYDDRDAHGSAVGRDLEHEEFELNEVTGSGAEEEGDAKTGSSFGSEENKRAEESADSTSLEKEQSEGMHEKVYYVEDRSSMHPVGTVAVFVGHKTSEAGGESDVVEKSEVRKERRERKWEEGISKDANDKDVDSPEAFAYHLHKEKPNDYKELAVLACVINCLFGIIALSFAFRSIDNWRRGDHKGAKMLGIAALVMSLVAIVTVAAIVIAVCWIFVR